MHVCMLCVCVFSALLWWFLFDYHSFFLDWYLQDSEGLCVPVSYAVFLTHSSEVDMCMHLSVYPCEFGGLLVGSPTDKDGPF